MAQPTISSTSIGKVNNLELMAFVESIKNSDEGGRKVVMKKIAVIGATMVALVLANWARADVCQIVNGSFEENGYIADITVKEPNGWDVNMPTNKFIGYIYNKWVTEGSYNLTLYTQWVKLDANDTAIVSQQIDLTDINEIIFDVNLATDLFAWDPNKVRAIVLIDNDVVWDSNDISSGDYYDQFFTVENKYRDGLLHTLSFGMRVKVSEKLWRTYYTHWDFIECTFGYGGFLPEDFNRDGCVNLLDFAMLANYWLQENPPPLYDLFENGIVDINDLGVFTDSWLDCNYPQ